MPHQLLSRLVLRLIGGHSDTWASHFMHDATARTGS